MFFFKKRILKKLILFVIIFIFAYLLNKIVSNINKRNRCPKSSNFQNITSRWCYIKDHYFLTKGYYFYDINKLVVLFLTVPAHKDKCKKEFAFYLEYIQNNETVTIMKDVILFNNMMHAEFDFKKLKVNDLSTIKLQVSENYCNLNCSIKLNIKRWNVPFESKPFDFAYCSKFAHYASKETIKNLDVQFNLLRQVGYQKIIFYDFNYSPKVNDLRKMLLEVFNKHKDIVEVKHFNHLPGFLKSERFSIHFDEIYQEKRSFETGSFNIKNMHLLLYDCYFANAHKFKYISAFEADDIVMPRSFPVFKVKYLLDNKNLSHFECDAPKSLLKNGLKRVNQELGHQDSITFPDSYYIPNNAIEKMCSDFTNTQTLKKNGNFRQTSLTFIPMNELGGETLNPGYFKIQINDLIDRDAMQYICDIYATQIKAKLVEFKVFELMHKNKILFNRFVFAIDQDANAKTIHNTSYSFGIDLHRFSYYVSREDHQSLVLNSRSKNFSLDVTFGSWAHFRRMPKRAYLINAQDLYIDHYYFKCLFSNIIKNLGV